MKCEVCKLNKATVHYTEIVQNKIIKINLCEVCAKKKGVGENLNFSMSDLIGGLSNSIDPESEQENVECNYCGLTFAQFKEVGRFGCDGCYESFEDILKPMFEAIHRSRKHVGKTPQALSEEKSLEIQLEELQFLLQDSIAREEFEDACRIRDQIKALKKSSDEKMNKKKEVS